MKKDIKRTLTLLNKIRQNILAERETLPDRLREEIYYENKRHRDENPYLL